ncbi:unnamed protein product [Amoebophrya sp. A25]|nr:unnamed protein product [Amoebophrya sp. A25]|eukprot:GSA25T00003497001.1
MSSNQQSQLQEVLQERLVQQQQHHKHSKREQPLPQRELVVVAMLVELRSRFLLQQHQRVPTTRLRVLEGRSFYLPLLRDEGVRKGSTLHEVVPRSHLLLAT